MNNMEIKYAINKQKLLIGFMYLRYLTRFNKIAT